MRLMLKLLLFYPQTQTPSTSPTLMLPLPHLPPQLLILPLQRIQILQRMLNHLHILLLALHGLLVELFYGGHGPRDIGFELGQLLADYFYVYVVGGDGWDG